MKFEFNWPSGFRGEDVLNMMTEDRRTEDGRKTDPRVIGIQLAHQ